MPRQDQAAAAASADLSANVVIPGPQGSTVLKNILLNRNDNGVRRMVQLRSTRIASSNFRALDVPSQP